MMRISYFSSVPRELRGSNLLTHLHTRGHLQLKMWLKLWIATLESQWDKRVSTHIYLTSPEIHFLQSMENLGNIRDEQNKKLTSDRYIVRDKLIMSYLFDATLWAFRATGPSHAIHEHVDGKMVKLNWRVSYIYSLSFLSHPRPSQLKQPRLPEHVPQ
jgi:hypothetical protein